MARLINKSKPAGSDAPSTLDNEQRTLRTAIQDIFGIPDNTTLANAGMSFLAGGLATINLSAAAVTAGTVFDIAAGHAQRDLVTSVGMGMNMQADTWDINAAGNGETVAVGSLVFLGIPTWTSTGTTFTVTDAAALYIQGVPVGSTNVTVTNAWALQVAAGNVKFPNSLYLTEQADADADIAGDGQIWVNTATPNELWFTDDAGTDFRISPEVGVWTPVLVDNSFGDGASEGQVYTTQDGEYTRAGNVVFITMQLQTSSTGTLTGSDPASIKGLPFTGTSEESSLAAGQAAGMAITAGSSVSARAAASIPTLFLHVWDTATGSQALTITQWSADGKITLAGHYFI